MAEITINDLMKKSKLLQDLMQQAAKEGDVEKLTALAKQAEAEGRALEQLGEQYRVQELKKRTGGRGLVEVVLTPAQRKQVYDAYGVQLESLVIEDEAGAVNQSMPQARLEYVTTMAMKEGERRKQAAEAERRVRAELERVMAEIDAVGNSDLSEQLRKVTADPNFASGMLHKK